MDGATRVRRLLDRQAARAVLGSTRAYRHAAALIFDRDDGRQMLFESMDWAHPARRGYWARNRALIARAAPLEDALVEDPIQVMFNGAVDEMRAVAGEFGRVPVGFAVSVTEYPDRDFSLVDVTAPGATKGHALAALAASLGVVRADVMAIGDNFNDVDMLEFAGVPVVMTNAAPSLRRAGWHVAPANSEAGVAWVIRRLALATPAP
jgi:hydroxymethylpyrimidine pyrophosphatase-like HAD family hydrolase